MTAAREPFDWLFTDRTHRRGHLQAIRLAIRRGWHSGPDHAHRRASLSAALTKVARDRSLTARETITLLKIHIEMDEQHSSS
jgi:hypothetical protein